MKTVLILVIALIAASPQGQPAPPDPYSMSDESQRESARQAEGFVNVNDASEEQLCLLWRTSAATAKAIVKNRPYEELSGLNGLPGIGNRWAVVNGPYLILDGPTTLKIKIKIPPR